MLSRFVRPVVKFIKAEDGPTAVEYAVMLALIIVVCIGAITTLGKNANSTFTTVANTIGAARKDVREGRTLPVPAHLRDDHYRGAEQFGHGQDYKYSHDYEGGFVAQAYLPEERRYYEPTDRGYEAVLRQRLAEWREKRG